MYNSGSLSLCLLCVCVGSCVSTPVGLFVCGCQCDCGGVSGLIVGNCRTMCEPVYVGVWHLSVLLWVTVVCVIRLWCPLTPFTKMSVPGGQGF